MPTSLLSAQMTQDVLSNMVDVPRAFLKIRGRVFEERLLETLGHASQRPFRIDPVLADRFGGRVDEKRVPVHQQVDVEDRGIGRPVPVRELLLRNFDLGARLRNRLLESRKLGRNIGPFDAPVRNLGPLAADHSSWPHCDADRCRNPLETSGAGHCISPNPSATSPQSAARAASASAPRA